jgi:hypothetical protein
LPPPPPRLIGPPLRRLVPPIKVAQHVTDTFGGALSATMDTLRTLLVDQQAGTEQQPRNKYFKFHTSPQQDSIVWHVDASYIVRGFTMLTGGGILCAITKNGLLAQTVFTSEGTQIEDAVYVAGTFAQGFYAVPWSLHSGDIVTVSKNTASAPELMIHYVAHVG